MISQDNDGGVFEFQTTIYDTRICLNCGEEVPCGIMHTVRHDEVCKRDAPNEAIDTHKFDEHWKEMDKANKVEEEKFDVIFKQMSEDEQRELVMLSMCGIPCGNNTFMMGREALNRINEYKQQMKNKYLK